VRSKKQKNEALDELSDIFLPAEMIATIIDFITDNKTFFSMAFICHDWYYYCIALYKKTEREYRNEIFEKTYIYSHQLVGSSIYHILRNEMPKEYHINFDFETEFNDMIKSLQNSFTVEKKSDDKFKLTKNFISIYFYFTKKSKMQPVDKIITDIDSLSIRAEHLGRKFICHTLILDKFAIQYRLTNKPINVELPIDNIMQNIFSKKFCIPHGDDIFFGVPYPRPRDPYSYNSKSKIPSLIFNDDTGKKLVHLKKLVDAGWLGVDTNRIKFSSNKNTMICGKCSKQNNSVYLNYTECKCKYEIMICSECFIDFNYRNKYNSRESIELSCSQCSNTVSIGYTKL